MRNLASELKTDYPLIWKKFEGYLEESFPNQKVIFRIEHFSLETQIALISGFLLSKKMTLGTPKSLRTDWAYFLKKLTNNKMVFINPKSGYACQKSEALKAITNIFGSLNASLNLQIAEAHA